MSPFVTPRASSATKRSGLHHRQQIFPTPQSVSIDSTKLDLNQLQSSVISISVQIDKVIMDVIENTSRESNSGKAEKGKTGQNEAKKRLQKELMELMMANEKGVSAFPEGDNLFR